MDINNVSINAAAEPTNLPVFMDTFLACSHLVCAFLGTPVNFIIIQYTISPVTYVVSRATLYGLELDPQQFSSY